jgi:NAD+ kinase
MPRRVLLLTNREKPDVVSSLEEVRRLIGQTGQIVGELDASDQPLTQNTWDAEVVVVLGGDGTLLSQSKRCLALGLPMLGVNLGKLGFMAEFDLPALRAQSAALFDGRPLVLQDRPTLEVTVIDGGAVRAVGLALNDAVVTAGPPFRMISLSMSIDGHEGPSVSGDGLIISTPLGSTAYNVSAGGAIVSPDVDAMTITPIAAHSLAFRPIVVGGSSTIELEMLEVNTPATSGGMGTSLVLDGQPWIGLHKGQKVKVRTHGIPVRFVHNAHGNYWRTLIQKMHWAAQPRMRGE